MLNDVHRTRAAHLEDEKRTILLLHRLHALYQAGVWISTTRTGIRSKHAIDVNHQLNMSCPPVNKKVI